jgi:hypothetical protein
VRGYDEVVEENLVHPSLNLLQDSGGYCGRAREVEPQPAGCVLRAHLGRSVTETLTKGAVDEVGCSVRSRDGAATLDVDLGND